MSTYILTSMFPNGLGSETAKIFDEHLTRRRTFAFVASEFEKLPEKTDNYFKFFLAMLADAGIRFNEAYVVDGRMTAEDAQDAVARADVIWLSGGDTPTQYMYLKKYGLTDVIKSHGGVIIGMSAGSINMAKASICTLACGHHKQEIYPGLGCVDISVEPHFSKNNVTEELLELSKMHIIYGLCDGSVIVCRDDQTEFHGEIYKIEHGKTEQIQ